MDGLLEALRMPEDIEFVINLFIYNFFYSLFFCCLILLLVYCQWFRDFDWDLLFNQRMPPPHIPPLISELDTSNFAEVDMSETWDPILDDEPWQSTGDWDENW